MAKPVNPANRACRPWCVVAALALVAAGGGIPAEAQSTWTGGGGDALWLSGANWASGTAPAANASLVFTGITQTSNTNNFTADTQFNGITFNNSSTAGSFTLSGNRITLGGNVTTTGTTGTPTQTISLDIRLNANSNFNAVTNNSIVIGGNISETGGARNISIGSGGNVTLNGSNTFSGTVSVTQGKLIVNSLANGGTASAIGSGASAISLGSGGSTGNLEYTGTGHSTNRSLRLNGSTVGATITANGSGPVTFNAAALLFANGSANKTLTLDGTSTAANTFASTIGDESVSLTTAITKNGIGTWALSGSNTFSRGVVLSAGQLNINNASAIGSGTMRISNTTKLDNTSGSAIVLSTANVINIDQNFTFVGSNNLSFATGSATVGTQNNSGYTVTMDGANSTLAFGVLTNVLNTGINNGNPTITVNNGAGSGNKLVLGGLNLSNSSTNARTVTFAGGANIDITGGVANGTATNAALTYSGSGILALSGSSSYTGATTVSSQANGGRLEIASGGRINSSSGITINGTTAEFRYNSATALTQPITFTRGTLSGTGTINTPVSVGANAILSPGNSPGSQTYQSGTFAAGGSYTWEINNWVSGTAGVNYDQAVFTNGLAITSSSASRFTINLTSLQADNTAGAVPNFNSGLTGLSFNIATGAMTGFSPSAFTLGTSSFFAANTVSGSANGGVWLSTNSGSTVLTLNYAPSARYALSATPAATAIYAGGSTTITGSITNSTADRTGADSMLFSGLSVGTGSLSVTSGTLASGVGAGGTVNFSSLTVGPATFTPSVSATNVNLGTAALAGTVTSGTVTVWNPAAVNAVTSPVSLGNVRVSGTFGTSSLSIQNTAAGGQYTEVLGATGSTSGQASLTGSVVALAGGSTSTAISIGLGGSSNTGSAGIKSGTATISFTSTGGPGTASISSQNVAVTGTVWNPAVATTSGSVHLGSVIVGATSAWTQALSVTNSAPNTGYSESLNASFGAISGLTTNSGSFNLLAAGATNNSALAVTLSSGSVGNLTGSAQINFATDGQGTSGLGTESLSPQTVNVYGTVLDHALPGFQASGITNAYTQSVLNINFGSIDQTAGTQNFTYNLLNLASQTYGAGLTAGLDFTGVTADGDGFASGLSTFNNLVGGGTSSLFTLSFTPTGQGPFSKTFTLSFYDNQSLAGASARRDLTINAQVIVVPEPGAMALAGIGVGLAVWIGRNRRRSAS